MAPSGPDASFVLRSGVVMTVGDLRGSGRPCPRSGVSSEQATSEATTHATNAALNAAWITRSSVPHDRPPHGDQLPSHRRPPDANMPTPMRMPPAPPFLHLSLLRAVMGLLPSKHCSPFHHTRPTTAGVREEL